MPTDVLSVYIDTPQTRILLDQQSKLIRGDMWDLFNSSTDVAVDDVTFTGQLLPLPLTDQWFTGPATGTYVRWQDVQYNIPTLAKWVMGSKRFGGDFYLYSLDVNEVLTTFQEYSKNSAHYLSWENYNAGNDRFIQMECGWVEPTADVSLRFWSDGKVDVYKGATLLGSGQIDELNPNSRFAVPYDKQARQQSTHSQQMANQTVDVLLIPCRHRELLILSNQGGGFSFCFDDIDPNDEDPTITAPGPFWWAVRDGQAGVSYAPLGRTTSGDLLSRPFKLSYPPPTGADFDVTVYYTTPGFGTTTADGSLVGDDGVTAFVPDGTLDTARIKVAMTGDGFASPFVYGASVLFGATFDDTADGTLNIDDYLRGDQKPSLIVPESWTDVRMTFGLRYPETLEAAGATGARIISNRPIAALLGAVTLLDGRTEPPKTTEGFADANRDLILEARDVVKAMERYRLKNPLPEDDVNLSDQMILYAKMVGLTDAEMDVEDAGFRIPSVGETSQGEWAWLPEAGDTVLDRLTKLRDTFAANWFIGIVPTAGGRKFRFRSEDGMGTTPVAPVFLTTVESYNYLIANGYTDPQARANMYRLVANEFNEEALECEANDITVVGRDPRSGLPIIAHIADAASQDPTTAIASRPANWVGEPLRYGLEEPGITTQEAANWVLGMLAARLFPVRQLAEWSGQFLFHADGSPVWRGDCVQIAGKGIYRILTLSGEFKIEYAAPAYVPGDFFSKYEDKLDRPFHYTARWVAEEP